MTIQLRSGWMCYTQNMVVDTRGERGRQAKEGDLQGMDGLWDSQGSRQLSKGSVAQVVTEAKTGVRGDWQGHGTSQRYKEILAN